MNFLNELKRRNVFRVGIAYLVAAWLLIQVVDTLGDLFEWPNVLGQVVVILLAIGFPVALVISWIYEMTPGGVTTQEAVDAGAKTTSGRKLNAVITGSLVLVILLLVVDNYILESEPESPEVASVESSGNTEAGFQGEITQTANPDDKTIAVLPFDNLSSDPEQEYFADGLSEELINRLSQIRDLQVTGRNSSFYYKNRDDELRDIGETLGVAHILQGSVRKSGNQIRVSAQLMDSREGFNLWTATFDRELADIFDVQDEIAEAVSTALSITMGAGDFNRLGMTRDVEAYDEYLQGLAAAWQFTQESVVKSVRHYENAIAIDPDFAMAYLSMARVIRFRFGELQNEEYQQKEVEARETANSLLPDMLETQLSNAQAAEQRRDWFLANEIYSSLAEDYENSSIEFNASYGQFLTTTGHLNEALRFLQKAKRLDPLQTETNYSLGVTLGAVGRVEEADEVFAPLVNQGLTLGPSGAQMSLYRLGKGDYEGAREAARLMLINNDYELTMIDFLEAGDYAGGLTYIKNRITENITWQNRHAMRFAYLYGDLEFALDILRHPEGREITDVSNVGGIFPDHWHDFFSDMRKLPGYKDYLNDVGLPEYWRATGWPDLCRPLEGSDDFECF